MAKTILVPTDFSIRSLYIIKCILEKDHLHALNIVQVAGVQLTQGITEILFFSRKTWVEKYASKEFEEACEIICNKYTSEINSMRVEIFSGYTQHAFSNFLEGNAIEEMYIPENELHFMRECFDPVPYMKRSALPQHSVAWPEVAGVIGHNYLGELFANWT